MASMNKKNADLPRNPSGELTASLMKRTPQISGSSACAHKVRCFSARTVTKTAVVLSTSKGRDSLQISRCERRQAGTEEAESELRKGFLRFSSSNCRLDMMYQHPHA